MRCLSVLVLLFLISPATAYALLPPEPVEYTCPIDGTKFSQMERVSDRTTDTMLDLQPVSAYGLSYPWPVPQCPNDGMLFFYGQNFTEKEVEVLKEYLATPEYRKMIDEDTTYWRIAKLRERLGLSLNERWFAMLQATWQTSGVKYDDYATEAIKAIETLLADPPKEKKERDLETWSLLLGELYRRIGDFDKARAIFEDLMIQPIYKNHDFYPQVIAYQLELIGKKDKSSHAISDIKKSE